jgi:hypothetical protein
MSRGDPVEFTRRLQGNDQLQRVGNRIQLEAFEIEADHVDNGTNADVVINLAAPGAGNHWRFKNVEVSFDAAPAAAVVFTITDGVTNYQMAIVNTGPHNFDFGRTRWASNGPITITLPAGGAGVTGYMAVLAARIERDIYS